MQSLNLLSLTLSLLLAVSGCENRSTPSSTPSSTSPATRVGDTHAPLLSQLRRSPAGSSTSPATRAGDASPSQTSVSGIPVRLSERSHRGAITTLDMEVAKMAVDFWKPTKIGESYYMCEIKPNSAEPTIAELRGACVTVRPNASGRLSEADRLNGIEWVGDVLLTFEAVRWHSNPPAYQQVDGKWKQEGTLVRLDFERINGKWERGKMFGVFAVTESFGIAYKHVDSSDLSQ
jgi:hypothetical protein